MEGPRLVDFTDLDALHGDVDARVADLVARHGAEIVCGLGCSDCCTDDFTVFEIEAQKIRARHADLFARGVPHPPGRCAILDDTGACRAYASRPYVCRTQGLPLRWLDPLPDGDLGERRDVCPKNLTHTDLLALDPARLWLLGPTEGWLATIQTRAFAGSLHRVSLRSLFVR